MLQQQQQTSSGLLQMSLTGREANFARSSWEVGLRPDKRQFNQLRECEIAFPTAERGICRIQIGKTIAVAKVTCKLVDPNHYSPKQGFVDFNVTSNSSVTEGGGSLQASTRSSTTNEIARMVETLFKTSKAIDTESLCVLPGRKVWSLLVDILIVNNAGNAMDASVWAAAGALQHFRRPELTILNDEVTVHPPHERDPVPLNIHHIPITVTSVLTGSIASASTKFGNFVIDPSPAEVLAGCGTVVVALNKELQVCCVHKNDGEDTRYQVIKQSIATAKGLVPLVFDLMDKAMAEDTQVRKEAALAQFEWAQKRTGVAAKSADKLPEKRAKQE